MPQSYLNTSADPDPDALYMPTQQPMFSSQSTLAAEGIPLLQEMQRQGVFPSSSGGAGNQDLMAAMKQWAMLQKLRQNQASQ